MQIISLLDSLVNDNNTQQPTNASVVTALYRNTARFELITNSKIDFLPTASAGGGKISLVSSPLNSGQHVFMICSYWHLLNSKNSTYYTRQIRAGEALKKFGHKNLGERQIRRIGKRLVELGLIQRERKVNPKTGRLSNYHYSTTELGISYFCRYQKADNFSDKNKMSGQDLENVRSLSSGSSYEITYPDPEITRGSVDNEPQPEPEKICFHGKTPEPDKIAVEKQQVTRETKLIEATESTYGEEIGPEIIDERDSKRRYAESYAREAAARRMKAEENAAAKRMMAPLSVNRSEVIQNQRGRKIIQPSQSYAPPYSLEPQKNNGDAIPAPESVRDMLRNLGIRRDR